MDWQQPGATTWKAPSFFQFTSTKLGYQREYKNPNSRTIENGESAASNELCMAIGHYFPAISDGAHTGHYCINNALVY